MQEDLMKIEELKKELNELSKDQNKILDRIFLVKKEMKQLEDKEINKRQFKLFK